MAASSSKTDDTREERIPPKTPAFLSSHKCQETRSTKASKFVVESVGEHVQEVAVGDMVVPVFAAQCSECPDCLSDRSNLCSKLPNVAGLMPRDSTTRFSSASTGEPIRHFLSVSSFTEYTVVDITHVVKLDASFPLAMACLLSCGISTGVGAACKVAAVEPGSSVAVFGLGAVGLAVAQGARMRGAKRIIGVDVNPDKFDVGKRLGMTDFINPNDTGGKTVSEVIKEITGGGGADYCFECIGSTSVMAEAFQSTRMELELEEFITHEMGFKEINRAFELLTQGKSLRCIIWMDGAKEIENGV
uniref:Alcohol dehydrogenase-like C-terminal domain-containing protein n=1 Tax=Oryza punctata TaxID=4537 RepID=A0A0E0LNH8_ORYPU